MRDRTRQSKLTNSFSVFCDHLVKTKLDFPTEAHFAIVLFKQETEYTPAYNLHDSSSSTTVDRTQYFAFDLDQEERWQKACEIFTDERANFVAMKVVGIATITTTIKASF